MAARRLRIATYNVHGCRGLDGRCDPARIAAVLHELEADVIALQEVESRPARSRFDQFETLAIATHMTPVAGPQILAPDGQFGNVLLSRVPILAVRRVDLSHGNREPRGAIDVDVEPWSDVILRLVATHLGRTGGERAQQIKRLLAHIDERPGERHATVLLGDVNEWWPRSRRLRLLSKRFQASGAPLSFPAALPLLALDRIWVSAGCRMRAYWVHRSRLARRASDHLPVVADLDCGPPDLPAAP